VAEKMPPGDNQNAYIAISEGYAHLADLMERDMQHRSIRGFMGTNAIVQRETAAD